MELKEIKEPKRSNEYWVNYWIEMNGKLGANHFKPQLQEMKEKIKSNCENMGLFCEQSKQEYHKSKDLIKKIENELCIKDEEVKE